MSFNNEVKTYYMSDDELAVRKKRINKDNAQTRYSFDRLTKSKYEFYKKHGLSDRHIIRELGWLTEVELEKLKIKWGLAK